LKLSYAGTVDGDPLDKREPRLDRPESSRGFYLMLTAFPVEVYSFTYWESFPFSFLAKSVNTWVDGSTDRSNPI